jgi:hypothetical protein
MNLTSQETLGRWLIEVLGEHGGSARKSTALRYMEEKYGHRLTADDRLPQPSNQEVKWENNTAWERNRLVKSGILKKPAVAGHGIWALTDLGWSLYRRQSKSA